MVAHLRALSTRTNESKAPNHPGLPPSPSVKLITVSPKPVLRPTATEVLFSAEMPSVRGSIALPQSAKAHPREPENRLIVRTPPAPRGMVPIVSTSGSASTIYHFS
jgi:hypothetical protein